MSLYCKEAHLGGQHGPDPQSRRSWQGHFPAHEQLPAKAPGIARPRPNVASQRGSQEGAAPHTNSLYSNLHIISYEPRNCACVATFHIYLYLL